MSEEFMIVPVERFELRRREAGGLLRKVGTFDKKEQAEIFRDQLIAMDVEPEAVE